MSKKAETNLLVTASSNNAVGNLLHRYIDDKDKRMQRCSTLLGARPVVRRYGSHLSQVFEDRLSDIHLEKICRVTEEDGITWQDDVLYKKETGAAQTLGAGRQHREACTGRDISASLLLGRVHTHQHHHSPHRHAILTLTNGTMSCGTC